MAVRIKDIFFPVSGKFFRGFVEIINIAVQVVGDNRV